MATEPTATTSPARARPEVRVPRWLSGCTAPILVLALARLYLLLVARVWGFTATDPSLLVKWDAEHYLSIAAHGYTLGVSNGLDGWPAGTYVGNAGWLPGYSLVIRLLSRGQWISPVTAGLVVSAACLLIVLLVMWNSLLVDVPPRRRLVCLMLVGFFPGFLYDFAVFPISMECLLVLAAVWGWWRGRWGWASLAAAGAGFTYATGFLLAPVLAIWVMSREPAAGQARWPRRLVLAAAAALPPLAGFGAALAMQWAAVGRWDAFFLVQKRYGHGLHNPLGTLAWFSRALLGPDWLLAQCRLQIFVVSVVVLGCVLAVALRWRRRLAWEQLLAIYALVFWLFPLVMGPGASPWRAMAMLMPTVPLLRRAPMFLLLGLLIIFLWLGWSMCSRFYLNAAI